METNKQTNQQKPLAKNTSANKTQGVQQTKKQFLTLNVTTSKNPGKEEKKEIIVPIKQGKISSKSVKKKYGKHVSNWLKKFNPWLAAIADPFNVRGVQIPDMVTTASGCFTIFDHRQLTVNSHNVCAAAFGISHPDGYPATPRGSLVPISYSSGENYSVGMVNPTTATSNALFGVTSGVPTSITLPQWTSVTGLYNQVRLVSFGVRVVFTGNYTNAQGTITIVSATRDWMRDYSEMSSGGLSITALQLHPDVQILSVPKDFGGQAIYKPLDTSSLLYNDVNYVVDLATEPIPASALGGEIYIAVSGAVEGQSFQMDAVWNFEAIPRTNQLDLISTNVSKFDSVSHESTWNALPDMPTALPIGVKGSGPEAKIPAVSVVEDKFMSEPHPAQERTMLEKVVDGLGSALDTGVKVAEKVAPFLAAVL